MTEKVMLMKDILQIFPHRYPLLLVDRIEIGEDEVVGFKNVTIAEIWFLGHFPENPVLPAIIITEAMSQVGGMCFYEDFYNKQEKYIGYIAGYEGMRFYHKVEPGDVLKFVMKKENLFNGVGKATGKVYNRDEKMVAKGSIIYAFQRYQLEG